MVAKEFKRIHGHCHVLIRYSENPELGQWCAKQRYYYQNNHLSRDKMQRLEDIGFIWDVSIVRYTSLVGNLACNEL